MSEYTLYHGDCLEVMKEIPDNTIDVAITDPPYGMGRDKGFGGASTEGLRNRMGNIPIERKRYKGNWDSERPKKKYFDEILRLSKIALIFGGNYFADFLPIGTHWIVWDKKQTMPTFGDCELIWSNINRNSVKWIQREWNGLLGKENKREHATQKPIKIMTWLVNSYTDIDTTVIDPFMGSGTTGVACMQTGRDFIGIEIDKNYYDIAERRIREAQMQLRLEI